MIILYTIYFLYLYQLLRLSDVANEIIKNKILPLYYKKVLIIISSYQSYLYDRLIIKAIKYFCINTKLTIHLVFSWKIQSKFI